MSNHGVTSSNLEFYLGTHAHSDHIDNADEIIRKFHPKVILSPSIPTRGSRISRVCGTTSGSTTT